MSDEDEAVDVAWRLIASRPGSVVTVQADDWYQAKAIMERAREIVAEIRRRLPCAYVDDPTKDLR